MKRRKWRKPCHCKYKPHTSCWMSLFAMYSCRVPFDNNRQWSCYLMISYQQKTKQNNIKKIKQRGMKTIYFDHIHTLWEQTDGQTRRGRTDAQRLAALRWPRFTFWGVLFNWFPTFFNPFEKCILLTLFSFLSKKHVFAVFQPLF